MQSPSRASAIHMGPPGVPLATCIAHPVYLLRGCQIKSLCLTCSGSSQAVVPSDCSQNVTYSCPSVASCVTCQRNEPMISVGGICVLHIRGRVSIIPKGSSLTQLIYILQVAGWILVPAAAMLALAAGTLSALDAALPSHSPAVLASLSFLAPALLPDRNITDSAPSQRAEIRCAVDLCAGSLRVSSGDSESKSTVCMGASVGLLAPADRQLNQAVYARSVEQGMRRQPAAVLLVDSGTRGQVDTHVALSGVGYAGTDPGSALPDAALRPMQLDAALHLAAAHGGRSADHVPVSVPAAVEAFMLQKQASEHGSSQMHPSASQVAAVTRDVPAYSNERTSDHWLDIGSVSCVLSGMVAKPLTAARLKAEPLAAAQTQHLANMLYDTQWQSSAVAVPSLHALPSMKGVRSSDYAAAALLGVRLCPSLSAVQASTAALQLAAASAAATDQGAFHLTATPGQPRTPAGLAGSVLTRVQSGMLAAVAKTLRLEAPLVHVGKTLIDPHASDNEPGTASSGLRLQLGATRDDHRRSDEHGVLSSGGADHQPALVLIRAGQVPGTLLVQGLPTGRGAVVITGKPMTTVCSHICSGSWELCNGCGKQRQFDLIIRVTEHRCSSEPLCAAM